MYVSLEYRSPVGDLTFGSDGENLTGVWIRGQKYFGGAAGTEFIRKEMIPAFALARDWLDRYFAGKQPDIAELPLAPQGSPFRRLVWELLKEIPYGTVVTYGELAKRAAARMGRAGMSGQAIGGAVGHNPLSIIIPCHRVVGADGSLTGYAGGLEVKKWLLEHEGVETSRFHMPERNAAKFPSLPLQPDARGECAAVGGELAFMPGKGE